MARLSSKSSTTRIRVGRALSFISLTPQAEHESRRDPTAPSVVQSSEASWRARVRPDLCVGSTHKPMRIALLSTCAVSVPPRAYGGTELVIAELAKMLTRLGH